VEEILNTARSPASEDALKLPYGPTTPRGAGVARGSGDAATTVERANFAELKSEAALGLARWRELKTYKAAAFEKLICRSKLRSRRCLIAIAPWRFTLSERRCLTAFGPLSTRGSWRSYDSV